MYGRAFRSTASSSNPTRFLPTPRFSRPAFLPARIASFHACPARAYDHSSRHAPNARSPVRTGEEGRKDIAYTRHELLADWHSYARKVSPLDVQWKGKDQIEAQCEFLNESLSLAEERLSDPEFPRAPL